MNKEEVIMETEQQVHTFAMVDLSDIRFPIIAIYEKPRDYPEWFVARVWNDKNPTDTIMLKRDLCEIREDIKKNFPWMVRLMRAKNDDPCIVETWF